MKLPRRTFLHLAAVRESVPGTFRTSEDVRLESAKRSHSRHAATHPFDRHRHFDARLRGAIGCVSLVEKRVLNAGSDGGNQCNGANSSHFLPALPLLDRRRLSLKHPRFTASVR